jgi:hypothetical protein
VSSEKEKAVMTGKSGSARKQDKEKRERRLKERQEKQAAEAADLLVVDEDVGQLIERVQPSVDTDSSPARGPVRPATAPVDRVRSRKQQLAKEAKELQRQLEEENRECEVLEKRLALDAAKRRKQELLLSAAAAPSLPSRPAATPVNRSLVDRLEEAATAFSDSEDEASVEPVTLKTIRKAPRISEKTDNRISDLGLSTVAELEVEQTGLRGKKPQSGRLEKVENNIKKAVVWPHVVVDPRFVSKLPTYEELDFTLLVAGELTLALSDSTSQAELKNRLNLLRLLCYCNKVCNWRVVKQFHSAALTEIEKGLKTWADNQYTEITTGVLLVSASAPLDQAAAGAAPAVALPAAPGAAAGFYQFAGQQQGQNYNARGRRRPRQRQQGAGPRQQPRFFCRDFNRGTCPHANAHRALLQGREQWVEHFCATCFLDHAEIVAHQETRDCPRYRAKLANSPGNQQAPGAP